MAILRRVAAAPSSPAAVGAGPSATAEAMEVGATVWIPSAAHAEQPYALGIVSGLPGGGEVLVTPIGGAQMRVRREAVALANSPGAGYPDDHCALVHLNEPSLLHSTVQRVAEDRVFTWLGASQLLSVNPCEDVEGLFGEHAMARFHGRGREPGEVEPHAYAVAEAACTRLHRQRSISILVSGQSGAGKTEAMRLVVQYLVWRASGQEPRAAADAHPAAKARADAVREGVLASNTVLEALGNARMRANANSSRFGKHVLLQVEPPAELGGPIRLRGATVECFLLERCRLCDFAPGERNFHVFYYLLAGTKPAAWMRSAATQPAMQLADASAAPPSAYAYLCDAAERALGGGEGGGEGSGAQAAEEAEQAAAAAGFKQLQAALGRLGMGGRQVGSLLRMVRAVLALGELRYSEAPSGQASGQTTDPPAAADPQTYRAIERLLGEGVEEALLATSLASPRSGTTLSRPNSTAQACAARDALAMALYQAAFDAVVAMVNSRLADGASAAGDSVPETIGVGGAHAGSPTVVAPLPGRGIALLDIFGFEVQRGTRSRRAPAADAHAGAHARPMPARARALAARPPISSSSACRCCPQVLATNSLEQLLINYTNEKLHQHFLHCTVRWGARTNAARVPAPSAYQTHASRPTLGTSIRCKRRRAPSLPRAYRRPPPTATATAARWRSCSPLAATTRRCSSFSRAGLPACLRRWSRRAGCSRVPTAASSPTCSMATPPPWPRGCFATRRDQQPTRTRRATAAAAAAATGAAAATV